MKNDYLEYYGEHSISPVKQDIRDFELHLERREKLYRQCGVPILTFKNAEMLEVGTGGGYNTLAFFQWNVKHADLVEANPKGIDDMQELFAGYGISEKKYTIFKNRIEDFESKKKYDIVIAEGFLPYIYNQHEVISKLQNLTVSGGIVVITCSDDICMYIEAMKRLVGIVLSANIIGYNKKVEYLTEIFEPQLKQLKGVSRNAREWVQDQILNPAGINGMELSLKQAIEYFENGFDILGSSPKMFTDYSWYKDVWFDYKKDYKEQFDKKRFTLLQTNMPEIILSTEQADKLTSHFVNIRKLAAQYEIELKINKIEKILDEMNMMNEMVLQYLGNDFMNVFQEIWDILQGICRNENVFLDKYSHFFKAFGRAQQYISFVKR